MAMNDILLVSTHESVTTLTLNRPDKFNALSEELLSAMTDALSDIGSNPSVAAVIIAANGKAFCAGHDLKQMRANHSEAYYQDLFTRCSTMMQQITAVPQPVIAQVNGMATAAGCQLVATCDLAIAADSAKFGVSGINLGLFCSTPSVALTRNIGRKRAFEMLLSGDFIDAPTAVDYGLINHCVAPHELESTTKALAAKIAAKPAAARQVGKKLFYQQINQPLSDAYQTASTTMACNMMSPETVENVDAFLEKRPVKNVSE
ncbi:MAG: enoyl-CoA hydratase [Pseudomonadota bacterium]